MTQNGSSGLAASEVFVDESIFKEKNSHGYESLKKLRKSKMEHLKLKEVSDKAFLLIDNRDRVGLMRHLELYLSVPIVDIVD